MSNQVKALTSVSSMCVGCPKKHLSRVVKQVQDGEQIPYQVVFSSSNNFDVLVGTSSILDIEHYVVYKCDDPMCLLNILRGNMMYEWLLKQRDKIKKEESIALARKLMIDSGTKRSNRRNRNKITRQR